MSLALPDGKRQASRLIFNVERFYWGFALVIAPITGLLSSFIASYWLKLGALPIELGMLSVCGAALIFLFQFPGALYRSFLIGS